MVWAGLRLPETLHPRRPHADPGRAHRRRPSARRVTNRQSIGYTLAMTAITGALFGFINSRQQIFVDVFHAADTVPAGLRPGRRRHRRGLACSTPRLVERLGSRMISHTALIGFITIAGDPCGRGAERATRRSGPSPSCRA